MCTTSAAFAERHVRRSPADFDIAASQHLDLAALGLTRQQCVEALQWVDAEGRVVSGHAAVAALLRAGRWWGRPLGHLVDAPGLRRLSARAYRWVAAHRHMFPGGTPACALPSPEQGHP